MFHIFNSTNDDLGLEISRILNGFFTSGYDKRVRPNYGEFCFDFKL